MKQLGKSRIFSMADEDFLIEAFAPVEGGKDAWRRIAFRAGNVDYLHEIDEKTSGITLKNGVTIPTTLPFAELKRQIFEPDTSTGNSIDLSLVTGAAVGAVAAVRLSKNFNPAAETAKAETKKPMEIIVFAHEARNDRNFRRLIFTDAMIDNFEAHPERKDSETYISLKKTLDDWDDFYIPLPLTTFTYYLDEAKRRGAPQLDLGEATRPKSTAALKMGF
ncbi:MAG: hypothetical protein PW788_11410 [Micavibrio sp.]|nr:hypothetical protein [Micavibrio sp.]